MKVIMFYDRPAIFKEPLEARFPGVMTILCTWITNYKGPGQMEIRGTRGVGSAQEILEKAAAAFELAHRR